MEDECGLWTVINLNCLLPDLNESFHGAKWKLESFCLTLSISKMPSSLFKSLVAQ